MVATVTINPLATTNAASTFLTTTAGFIQGTALDSPAVRYELAGGILASSETLPMWGGIGVSEAVPGLSTNPVANLGGQITRATNVSGGFGGAGAVPTGPGTVGNLTGFSVFDQDYAAISSPQSPVPLVPSGGLVNFYRLGSNARIVVACDAALAATLIAGGTVPVTTNVSWDFGGQQLAPYNAAWAANVITASSWAATGGGQVTFTTTTAHGVAVGADFTITGEVPTGYNGTFKAITGTTGSTLVAALTTNPGASTTQGTLAAGGGALGISGVLEVNQGGSMTVSFNAATGFATWNYAGTTAVIRL
jgi:hypothetical protein